MDYLTDMWLWLWTALAGIALGAVTHPTGIRNGICDHVVDQLDLNSPPGKLKFLSASDAIVATLTFSPTAFGAASGGTAIAATITPDSSAIGGTIAKATLCQGGGNVIIQCSVSDNAGTGDIKLNSVNVSAGQTVSMTSLTYSAPA